MSSGAGPSTCSSGAGHATMTTSRSACPLIASPSCAQRLGDMEFVVVGDGKAWPLTESTLTTHRQTWVRERDGTPWRLDVIREPWEDDVWIYRRDPRIQLRATELVRHTVDRIPYASPEVI